MAADHWGTGAPRSMFWGLSLTIGLMIVLAAAQSAWPTWLRISGQTPELVLAAVIVIGLCGGAEAGLAAGFWGAWSWGGVTHLPWGHLFLAYMGLGFVAGALRGGIFSERLVVAIVLVALGVIIAGLIALVWMPPPTPAGWLRLLWARTLLSVIFVVFVFPLARRVGRLYPSPEQL